MYRDSDLSRRKPGNRIVRVLRTTSWKILIPPPIVNKKGPKASLWTLVYGFAFMILIGTLLLLLPVANNSGQFTSPITALFTATSAVCVTGLVVVDTLDHWSMFGQSVILVLIQLGGLGFMTITTILLLALGRKIGLREKLLIGESMGLSRAGGMVGLVRNMVIFTLAAEIVGAAVLFIRFSTQYSTWEAVWKSFFQAVSAFNNAGFDLFGGFRSLSGYNSDWLVLITTAALLGLGGISYLVVEDVFRSRKFSRFFIDTKIVIVVSLLLLAAGTIVVMATEYANPATLGNFSFGDKILNAFFQAASSRTAGFSAIPTGGMADYALFFTMLLMLIGGASGSTAGGVKVNTFGMLMATIWSVIRGKEYPGAFNREFMTVQIFRGLSVLVMALATVGIVTFALSITEEAGFINVLFEAVSAFGTTGLSTGITPDLSSAGKLIIIVTMFIGRLGPLTLTLALIQAQRTSIYRYPREIVRIG